MLNHSRLLTDCWEARPAANEFKNCSPALFNIDDNSYYYYANVLLTCKCLFGAPTVQTQRDLICLSAL